MRILPLVALTASAAVAGCGLFQRVHVPGASQSDIRVPLHGHDLDVRLSMPGDPRADRRMMLLYATGDAGWFGKDLAIFTQVARWGYPAAGFSAREYVHHLGADQIRPIDVADDFRAIIGAAEGAFHLPADTRVVLVGKSRGAGLAIAAAGPPELRPLLDGVLAVGLTKEEEYVHHRVGGAQHRAFEMLETYPYLSTLGATPVAVIQSSRDEYVAAAEARQLFGPDTPVRRFVGIDADDHNFTGALPAMYAEMERAFLWIVER